jgi:hypothetical protein
MLPKKCLPTAQGPPFPLPIARQLIDLDKYQEICDLENFSIKPPELAEIPAMLDLAEKVGELARKEIAAVEE